MAASATATGLAPLLLPSATWAVSAANATALLRRWATAADAPTSTGAALPPARGTATRAAPAHESDTMSLPEGGAVVAATSQVACVLDGALPPPVAGRDAVAPPSTPRRDDGAADATNATPASAVAEAAVVAMAGVKRRRDVRNATTTPVDRATVAGAAAQVVAQARKACPHGRPRHRCKECGGAGICDHGRERRYCKVCGGTRMCVHGRRRNDCKECGGASICKHRRVRSKCKECGGGSICEHGRGRYGCRECGGTGVCEHGRQRYRCKECGGTGICEHGRQRYYCKKCGGAGVCEHGRHRRACKDCVGVCAHGQVPVWCLHCRAARAASAFAASVA